MENKIKIGDTVITRKFETTPQCTWWSYLDESVNQEGVVTDITDRGNYRVHDYYWPPSAVELVTKQWEPKPGDWVEVRQWDKDNWEQAKFIGMD